MNEKSDTTPRSPEVSFEPGGIAARTVEIVQKDSEVFESRSQEAREHFMKRLDIIERANNPQEVARIFDIPAYPGGNLSERTPEQIEGLLAQFIEKQEQRREEFKKKGKVWGLPGGGGENLAYDNYMLAQAALEKIGSFSQ